MNICGYINKPCEFWENDDPENDDIGSCLAIDPMQCPYNTEDDIKAIKESQERIIEEASKDE